MTMFSDSMLCAGGGVQTQLSFLQAETQQNVTQSSYTFTSVNIGAADVNRVVAVAVYIRSNTSAITSATIGGVSATVLTSVGGNTVRMQIIYASVPTGSTANVVVNLGATATSCNIGTYRIITATPTHTDSQTVTGASGSTSLTALTGCNVGIWIVAHTGDLNGQTLTSVTNGTIDVNVPTFNSNRTSACGRMTLPSSSMSFTLSTAGNIAARNIGWT